MYSVNKDNNLCAEELMSKAHVFLRTVEFCAVPRNSDKCHIIPQHRGMGTVPRNECLKWCKKEAGSVPQSEVEREDRGAVGAEVAGSEEGVSNQTVPGL